ncbi:MAG: hypothetical protein H6Q52_2095 [Deltaproteobacteria bacterium]|nr:hypothetical protein [Deltaproteobacteria bacterium]
MLQTRGRYTFPGFFMTGQSSSFNIHVLKTSGRGVAVGWTDWSILLFLLICIVRNCHDRHVIHLLGRLLN